MGQTPGPVPVGTTECVSTCVCRTPRTGHEQNHTLRTTGGDRCLRAQRTRKHLPRVDVECTSREVQLTFLVSSMLGWSRADLCITKTSVPHCQREMFTFRGEAGPPYPYCKNFPSHLHEDEVHGKRLRRAQRAPVT